MHRWVGQLTLKVGVLGQERADNLELPGQSGFSFRSRSAAKYRSEAENFVGYL
jgi:hypothetical protein